MGDYSNEPTFGFEYEYAGKQYAAHMVAASREEAEARIAALSHAQFVGELRLVQDNAVMGMAPA